jgi:flavodoxin
MKKRRDLAMKILIIYDSVFGNTEQAARAMADALQSRGSVGIVRVGGASLEQLSGLNLLVVGSPTRGFRPTEAIRDFLKRIPADGLRNFSVAAFDTRIALSDIRQPIFRSMVKIGGFAAKPIADMLKKKGGIPVAEPEGFCVKGSEGPLKDGELQRAADWAILVAQAR